jgi:hypothetical protein
VTKLWIIGLVLLKCNDKEVFRAFLAILDKLEARERYELITKD